MSSHEPQLTRPVAEAPAPPGLPWSRGEKFFVLVASALFLALCIGSIRTEAVTANETVHVPSGLSYLQRFDARMNIQHPPLIKMLAALPLLLLHAKPDYSDSTWNAVSPGLIAENNFGEKSFESWTNRGTLLFLARLPMIVITLLLGLSLYAIARQLAGTWGGALTLTLFVTSPFFISYGSLVLTDVPVALFAVWTMWYFASLWQEPTWRNAIMFSVSLAGALLTKFTAIFLFPTLLLCWAWFHFPTAGTRVFGALASAPAKRLRREKLAVAGIVLAGFIVYIFYLGVFHRTAPLSLTQNEVTTLTMDASPIYLLYRTTRIMTMHPGLERPLLPLWLYVDGLAFVKAYEIRRFYFLGRIRPRGVWFYFPVMSFFKLAPGMVLLFLLLAVLAAAKFLRNKGMGPYIVPVSRRRHVQAMLAALVVFAAIPMASALNVGVRHFSVPITLLVLLSSLVVPLTQAVLGKRISPFVSSAVMALAVSCVVTALLSYPHYISYYNAFRLKMPKQEIAVNANLTWGQSVKELNSFFEQRHVSASYVDARLSTLDPAVYIPGARAWLCDKEEPVAPAWVAVAADRLLRNQPGCQQLLRYPSFTVGDGSIVVFHIVD